MKMEAKDMKEFGKVIDMKVKEYFN